ncbi:MAG: DEAD/DEAH box helicase [Ignavibacteriales bacterium]|nr:DEAD/DEAH box helicase [Ignavibacteriales bacterium]
MNIFQFHQNVINEYSDYINSFIDIKDEKIRSFVKEQLSSQKLWPDPLIQFNPSYEKSDSIESLSQQGTVVSEMIHMFKGYQLYKHQVEALRLGTADKDFIVTSGTGSGKSLTFMGTVFNHLFKSKQSGRGVKALIVYPMNALINSQTLELDKWKQKYETNSGLPFPITYKQYTGQEGKAEREEIKSNPPDILLTNYMMLELIITRLAENEIKNSISDNLRFLVFDELHTYRGRQGSDVSLLIRRIRSLAKSSLVCIGTSATMISGESYNEQKNKVAEVATRIFGKPFTSEQIIDEKLINSLGYSEQSLSQLQNSLQDEINSTAPYDELLNHPLASWIENEIALTKNDGVLIRRKPLNLRSIAQALSEKTNENIEICLLQLMRLLKWANYLNNEKDSDRKPILPFKLHQFISQTGSVYITLDAKENRVITLDPSSFIKDEKNEKKPIYPVVFSRISGHEFICVRKNLSESILEPREFNHKISEEEEESFEQGYIITADDSELIWDESQIGNLPDSWVKQSKSGDIAVVKEYKDRIPQKIYFNEYGIFSDKDDSLPLNGWYIAAPLLFDPTGGAFYDRKTSESTKLAKLGTEGRSTSTTVLSFSIIKSLHDAAVDVSEQKILSFTDNRQDAALQAGHFNDFIKIGRLRSAIYYALKNSEQGTLDYSTIASSVFETLNLSQEIYAKQYSPLPFQADENNKAFKNYIMYRLLTDLKRGWRVVLPNLEQCALLEIKYKFIDDTLSVEDFWKDTPIVKDMNLDERRDFIQQILDYFRRNYSLSYSLLESNEIERLQNTFREKIKPEWGLDKDEKIDEPSFMRVEAYKSYNQKLYTVSLGPQSYFGKYLKSIAKKYNYDLSGIYNDYVHKLLDKLEKANWLTVKEINSKDKKIKLYRLKVDSIIWKVGDGKNILPDKVRILSYKNFTPKPNHFFQSFYLQRFDQLKTLEAREHTAQIKNDVRKDREERFRNGEISLLNCSPTMELGIDISTLNIVHLRNVPPNPSNYAQRGGRAGRSGQAALIFTFCSNYSPHDKHFFNHPTDMVAGAVSAPRLDLYNEELLCSHLNAIYLSEVGLGSLNDSLANMIVMEKPDELPLKDEVVEKLNLSMVRQKLIHSVYKKAIQDLLPNLEEKCSWFSDEWITRQINDAPRAFNKALDRWRELFKSATRQLYNAQQIINDPILSNTSEDKRKAYIEQKQANRQLDLLKNTDSDSQKNTQLSEFYPYRYFASEGFLPGYNFTRLPLRAFVPKGEEGEFISRARFLALREFGPGNIIYHDGNKYKIIQTLLSDTENKIEKIKVSKSSGYAFMKDDYNLEFCPFTDSLLNTDDERELYTDLLPMAENRTMQMERINCEEEERLSLGFDIKTFFTVEGGLKRIRTVFVNDGKDQLLKIRYIPAATLIKINERWRIRKEPGFLINMKTGFWKKESILEDKTQDQNNIRRVRLFTTDTADALYIHPLKALAFNEGFVADSIITLQYAMKRAIENVFQVESNEIGVEVMGKPEWPNIFIYEAAEGSLGVLSQVVEKVDLFKTIIQEAYKICYYENGEDTKPGIGPATYSDLLSYYNQRDHMRIDRQLIKQPLEKLLSCQFEISTNPDFKTFDEQYKYLEERIDPHSSTERKFLDYLCNNGLKLPDKTQVEIPGIYVKPDFFYEKENACVFCDGTPHDDPIIKKQDALKREALLNAGYDVIVYYYKDSLDDLIKKRSDIFIKVK